MVPVIHIGGVENSSVPQMGRAAALIGDACQKTGFFSVTGHGVPPSSVQALRKAMKSFFSLSIDQKMRVTISDSDLRGYIPFSRINASSPGEKPDYYEAYKIYRAPDDCSPDPRLPPNIWPEQSVQLQAAIARYWQHLSVLSRHLLRLFAMALELPVNYFDTAFSHPLSNMTLLHYPPAHSNLCTFGIHPHKDTDVLTIIHPDPVGCLEIQMKDGRWIEVSCPQDALLVNIGDMMEVWSGGLFVSTPHRVFNKIDQHRYSFPFFVAPSYEATVTPAVEPVRCFKWAPIVIKEVPEYARLFAIRA